MVAPLLLIQGALRLICLTSGWLITTNRPPPQVWTGHWTVSSQNPGCLLRRQYDITPPAAPPFQALPRRNSGLLFLSLGRFSFFFFPQLNLFQVQWLRTSFSPFSPPHISLNTFPDLAIFCYRVTFFLPICCCCSPKTLVIKCDARTPVKWGPAGGRGSTYKLFYWLGWIIDEDRMCKVMNLVVLDLKCEEQISRLRYLVKFSCFIFGRSHPGMIVALFVFIALSLHGFIKVFWNGRCVWNEVKRRQLALC